MNKKLKSIHFNLILNNQIGWVVVKFVIKELRSYSLDKKIISNVIKNFDIFNDFIN